MGKRKVSVIAVAILTCIVCVSMIAGATFALFTDNDRVDVSVTTAKLDVSAEITDVEKSSNGTDANDRLFAEYDAEEKLLTVDNMLPGDVVTFKVTVTSNATVDVKYRVNFGCTDENSALFDQLLLGVKDTVDAGYQYYVSSTSAWDEIGYNADSSKMVKTKYVAIELPAFVSAKALEDQTCHIEFAVEAVQANASGAQYETAEKSVKAYRVSNQEQLTAAVAAVNNGEVIVIDREGGEWEINDQSEQTKSFAVRGGKLEKLTINAPNAEIDYRVDKTATVDVIAVKGQSLHIFGAVDELTVKSGHAVVEQGAQVLSAVAAPVVENAVATILAKEVIGSATVTPAANTTAAIETIANIGTLTVAGEGAANVEVAKEVVVENLIVNNTNKDTAIENNGTVENVQGENIAALSSRVTTVDELVKALNVGGEIILDADIELPKEEYHPSLGGKILLASKDNTVLDLNGKTLSVFNVALRLTGANIVIKNGNIGRASDGLAFSYGIKLNGVNTTIDNVKINSGINVSGYNSDDSVKEGVSALIKNSEITLDCEWAYYAVCAQGEAAVAVENSAMVRTHAGKANNWFWIEKEFTDDLGHVNSSALTAKDCTFNSDCDTIMYNKGGVAPEIIGGTVYVDTPVEFKNMVADCGGATIVLTDDITINEAIKVTKSVTINLDSHVITSNVTGSRLFTIGTANAFVNDVTFVINGENGGIVIPESNTGCYGIIDMFGDNQTVIINGGSYIGDTDSGALLKPRADKWTVELNNVTASTNFHIINSNSTSNGTLKVNGGEYTATGTASAFFVISKKAEFTNVKIDSAHATAAQLAFCEATLTDCNFGNPNDNPNYAHFNACVGVSDGSNITINGGRYEGKYAVYIYNSGATVNITDGTFIGDIALKADTSANAKTDSIFNVSGGTFDGIVDMAQGKEHAVELNVTGGTFTANVSTAAELEKALKANVPNYAIVLNDNITYNTNTVIADKNIVIDLNEKTITTTVNNRLFTATGTTNLTVKNGTISVVKMSSMGASVIAGEGNAVITCEKLNIVPNNATKTYSDFGYGVSAFDLAQLNIKGCKIVCGGGVTTNAAPHEGYTLDQKIIIKDSIIEGFATGVMLNTKGTLEIANSTVSGINQAVIVRAGEATITDSYLYNILTWRTLDENDEEKQIAASASDFNGMFENAGNWQTGTNLPLSVLVVGCATNSYANPAKCTLINTKVEDTWADYVDATGTSIIHYGVLVWGNADIGYTAICEYVGTTVVTNNVKDETKYEAALGNANIDKSGLSA